MGGIEHVEHYYLDGSCPTMSILQQVLKDFEAVPHNKAFAVHCKAGLGRTGTCIGAYIMKHYKFTAAEIIGWMRICRPGMVIGPQQNFLEDIQERMWYEGDLMRSNLKDRSSITRTTNRQQTNNNNNNHNNNADSHEDDEVNVRNGPFKADRNNAFLPGLEALSMQD